MGKPNSRKDLYDLIRDDKRQKHLGYGVYQSSREVFNFLKDLPSHLTDEESEKYQAMIDNFCKLIELNRKKEELFYEMIRGIQKEKGLDVSKAACLLGKASPGERQYQTYLTKLEEGKCERA